ncbi:MAG: endolytic transglycosylase MltG [Pseudomonadota bacterium]
MKTLLKMVGVVVAIGGVLALGAGLWAYRSYQSFLDDPLPNSQPVPFTITSGQGFAAIIKDLEDEGLIQEPWHWWVLGRRSALASRIQAGEYQLSPGLRPNELLTLLAEGRVVQHALTIVEGWRFSDLAAAVDRHPALDHTLLELPATEIARRIDPELDHLEGWFLPETYYFPRNTTDVSLYQRAYAAMQQALAEAWERRDPEAPLTAPEEMLILASIVEKETGLASERAQIAGVFLRRLELRMRLQTDPTVIYGLGDAFDGNLRRRDLRSDTPYNTYTRFGLPPTPIALPGRAALDAVAQPEAGKALYFVARGDGSHQFSETLEAHNQAVQEYQINPIKNK